MMLPKSYERTVPRLFVVPRGYTNAIGALLRAMRRDTLEQNPVYVELARSAARRADTAHFTIDERLQWKRELERVWNHLHGEADPDDAELQEQSGLEFWLDMWDWMVENIPQASTFLKFTRDDLIAEVLRDTEDCA